MQTWRIGCSGFHYHEWKEVFYPKGLPQNKWFDYYTEHFNTLEINGTFYKFPQLQFMENLYAKSPECFSFSVKAPMLITHYKQLIGTERMLNDFYGTIREGLKEKLGCVLFQLPERVTYSEKWLLKITEGLDKSFLNVVEFRHDSWWQEHVYSELAAHSIIFCGQSHPKLPDVVIKNNPSIYYRFHGVPKIYKSQYLKKKVHDVVDQVKGFENTRHVYIYFNNTMAMAGIRNAKQAIAYCEKIQKSSKPT